MKTEALGPSLLGALAEVLDPRPRHSRRHPLPADLALATAAMLSFARSLYAIAQWGREQPEVVVCALGCARQQTPGVATLHLVFKALAVEAFEAVLVRWAQAAVGGRREAIAIDGKALRESHGEQVPGARLVAVYEVRTSLVLAQRWVRRIAEPAASTEDELAEGKAQAELSVAPALLGLVPLRGRVVTGDALYCQRTLCQQIRAAHGHCLLVIKANRPELLAEVALLFDQPPPGAAIACAGSRRTRSRRRGGRRRWICSARARRRSGSPTPSASPTG